MAWSTNGNYLVSAGKDSQVIVWNATSKDPVIRSVYCEARQSQY